MYSFNFVSIELGSLIEITSGILSSRKRLDGADREKVRLLLDSIRNLYADDPIIDSLKAFADGANLEPQDVASAALQLDISEKKIGEAIDLIKMLMEKRNVFISLEALEQIKGALGGKAGLRFELSLFVSGLWHSLKSNDEVLIQLARKQGAIVVQMIEHLNEQLRAIDLSLRQESLSHG